MKKQLLIAALTLGMIGAKAQTNVEVKWRLFSDGSATSSDNSVTFTNQSLYTGTSNVEYGKNPGAENSFDWQHITGPLPQITTPVENYNVTISTSYYIEYKIQGTTGKYLQINNISMDIVGTGGTNYLVAYYSTDNFASMEPILTGTNYAIYNPNTTTPITSSLVASGSPLSLMNLKNSLIENQATLIFPGLNINIPPGKSFTIRLYPFYSNSKAQTSRDIYTKNITITGRTDTQSIPDLLPLNFLDFNVSQKKNGTQLNWTTTNEVNTDYFSIEKNTGKDFESIGTLKSNNISGINQYTYTDLNRNLETAYYRIKQVDLDGKSSYSNTISVKPAISYTYYPNPAKDYIIINGLAKGKNICSLHTISGKQLRSWQFDGNLSEARIDLSDTNSQVLFLKIQNEQGAFTHKIIKE